jgi:hypothetical protein
VATLDAEKGPYFIATLSGRVSGLEDVALDFECGIEYSTDETFSDENLTYRLKVDKEYTEESYSVTVSGIQLAQKYYYIAYYINQLHIYYGEVKSFTFEWTAPDVTTLSAELNESYFVILKGLIKDKEALKDLNRYYYGAGFYGIKCSTTETFDPDSTITLYPDKTTDNMNNDSIICTMTQFRKGITYYYRTFFGLREITSLGQVKSFKFEWNGPEMVDMGLSVRWATFNVGATAPEEYGDYYAWGEIEPYYEVGYSQEDPQAHWKDGYSAGYDWLSYKYCDGSNSTLTKYNNKSNYGTVDNKTTLDPEDDVAHVKWGGNWRMPTEYEFEELRNTDNCTWTWTTKNGVNGYLVTSKKRGYEGVSIFLPAAGGRSQDFLTFAGKNGYYWSSSLVTLGPDNSSCLIIGSSNKKVGGVSRAQGFTVRPVYP